MGPFYRPRLFIRRARQGRRNNRYTHMGLALAIGSVNRVFRRMS